MGQVELLKKKLYTIEKACKSEVERLARMKGEFGFLQGQVIKAYDHNVHKIKPIKLPEKTTRYLLIDDHADNMYAVSFVAVTEDNTRYVYDEIEAECSVEELAELVFEKEKRENIFRVICDPTAMAGKSKDTGITLERLYKRHFKLPVIRGSQKRSSGLDFISDWLSDRKLFIFDTCELHLYEISHWVRGKNGKPEDKDDHFMQNLWRLPLDIYQGAYIDKTSFESRYKPIRRRMDEA